MNRFFNNNNFVRLTAVVVAIVLWFTVNSGTDEMSSGTSMFSNLMRTFSNRPIEVLTAPGYVVTSVSDSKATIVLHGSPFDIAEAQAQSLTLHAIADATKLTAGQHTVMLTTNLPSGLHWDVKPASVVIRIERRVSQTTAVQVLTTGVPASGYAIGDPKVEQSTATITGPETLVYAIKALEAKVDVTNVKNSIVQDVRLHAVDATGHDVEGLSITPETVKASVPVGTLKGRVPIKFLLVGNLAKGYGIESIDSPVTNVAVYAKSDTPSFMDKFLVPIDVSDLNHDVSLSVKPTLPAGIVAIEPQEIDVAVHIAPIVERTIEKVPIVLSSGPKGTTVTIQGPDTVSVIVSGTSMQVKAIKLSDLRVTVNASQLASGTATASVQVKVNNPYVNVVKVIPDQVNVRVTNSGP